MRIPRSRGHESLRRIVSINAETFTVTRGDGTIGTLGQRADNDSTHQADAYVFAPRNSPMGTDYGDRLQGELNALALPSEDFQHGDEIDHGGETYTVEEPFHVPDESDKVLKVFALTRKTN